MAAIGNIALVFAFLTTLYAVVLGYLGVKQDNWNFRQSAAGATIASFCFVMLGSGILWYALLISDFSFSYVANYTKEVLPWYYKFSAFWAGQSGSLLFWILVLSFVAVIIQFMKYPIRFKIGINHVLHATRLGFLTILMTTTPPFRTVSFPAADGLGLNPMLQSLGMIIHPPLTFFAFALFTVPFGIVIYNFYTKANLNWGKLCRPWLLWSWFMLTAGIITGGQWAYTELGWGGYWAWDPVENASLFPWLTATALLHTLALQRRGRGYEKWNYFLIIISFLLCIFGTFITRSGIIDSVHSFSNSRVGLYFILMILCLAIFSGFVYFKGKKQFNSSKEASIISLDGGIRIFNVLLIIILVGVFLGTMFPFFSEIITGRAISVQERFYNQITIPFWFVILFLLGFAPALPWFKATSSFKFLVFPLSAGVGTILGLFLLGITNSLALAALGLCVFALMGLIQDLFKNKQRFPSHLIHIGVILIAFGITGSIFDQEALKAVDPQDTVSLGDYSFKYQGIVPRARGAYTHVSTTLTIYREDQLLGQVTGEKVFHPTYNQPATNIGVFSTLKEDIYFNLSGWEHDHAFLHLSIKPLVVWIWIGSYLMYVGAILLCFRKYS